ncbi:MAG: transcription termination factor Rho [Oscillospiraceae bacterium]|nr:transcription termination factor Rho [Oscillospiraceae bacterium]
MSQILTETAIPKIRLPELDKMILPDLKQFARDHGITLAIGMNKASIIQRIKEKAEEINNDADAVVKPIPKSNRGRKPLNKNRGESDTARGVTSLKPAFVPEAAKLADISEPVLKALLKEESAPEPVRERTVQTNKTEVLEVGQSASRQTAQPVPQIRRADESRADSLKHPAKSAEPPSQNRGFVEASGDLSGTSGNAQTFLTQTQRAALLNKNTTDNRSGNVSTYSNNNRWEARPINSAAVRTPVRSSFDGQQYNTTPRFNQGGQNSSASTYTYNNQNAVQPRAGYQQRFERVIPAGAPTLPELLSSGECTDGEGILELHQDGYGFLRGENYQASPNDVYISIAQIRRFNLKNGDKILGKVRPLRDGERNSALLYITTINGISADQAARRPSFDDMMPIYPDERLTLENDENRDDLALRVIDIIAPIGKGQRGLIVSPPKAGKTILLKKISNAIASNFPEAERLILLIDERPEEVTDFKRSLKRGEVVYSTFDETPDNHTRIAELVSERAQRLVESGKDVIILLDSITRLARAYNAAAPQTGRAMSGGLAPGVLQRPKRFFGSARKIEKGGSLTIIATALVDTGSRMDDIIYEEFKGTGNMEIHLDRKLSEKRIFPAIDLAKSGTRREDLLLSQVELEGVQIIRKILSSSNAADATEQLIATMAKTQTNDAFFIRLKEWMALWEKDGYSHSGRSH